MRMQDRFRALVSCYLEFVGLLVAIDRVHLVFDRYLSIFVIDGKARLSQPAARLAVGRFHEGLVGGFLYDRVLRQRMTWVCGIFRATFLWIILGLILRQLTGTPVVVVPPSS